MTYTKGKIAKQLCTYHYNEQKGTPALDIQTNDEQLFLQGKQYRLFSVVPFNQELSDIKQHYPINTEASYEESEANAKRIVELWNLFDDIDNPTQYIRGLKHDIELEKLKVEGIKKAVARY